MTQGPASAAHITRQYLYGSQVTPTVLSERLRDLPPDYHHYIEIDANSYMAGYGAYAVPARAQFVKDFFQGAVSLAPGAYTVESLKSTYNASLFRFAFQHAQVDPGNTNYMERAYVFGHASFYLSDDTRFVVAADGTRSIENVRVVPEDENFDFVSAGLAQYLNDYYLRPNIDPSQIGRVVDIHFSGIVSAQIYTSQAFAADIGRIASWGGTVVSDSTYGFELVRGKPAVHRDPADNRGVRFLRGLFVLAGAALASACAPSRTAAPLDPTPAAGRWLDGAELRAALVGKRLCASETPADPAPLVISTRHVESFPYIGSYVLHSDRVSVRGTFSVDGNSFCVSLAGSAQSRCRRLFRDERGGFWVADVAGQFKDQLRRVVIE